MEGLEPSQAKPVKDHPNAVKSAPVTFHHSYRPDPNSKPEPEPALPKPKHEPVKPDYYKDKNPNGRWIFIVIIVLLVLGAFVYWFLLKSKPAKAPSPASSSNSSSSQISLNTTHYDSSNFNLGFDYPQDWKVNDVAGSGILTVTSPTMKLKNTSGQQVDGQIVMTIRDKTQKLTEFDKGNATAVLDSQKIAYTKPTQTQRANTYISFLNYASSSVTGIDGIYITGDAGYQKGQAIPLVDISKIDPVTDVTFIKAGKAFTIATSSWSDNSFSKPITSMLQSLAIQ